VKAQYSYLSSAQISVRTRARNFEFIFVLETSSISYRTRNTTTLLDAHSVLNFSGLMNFEYATIRNNLEKRHCYEQCIDSHSMGLNIH
jgi:hypothetical protein